MSERKTFTLSELQEKVLNAPLLTDSQKLDLMALLNGKKVADLTYNIMAKNIFSPNSQESRFDFLLQRIMKEKITQLESNTNYEKNNVRKVICDITSHLKDGRSSNSDVQNVVQEFIFSRFEIYTSRILMMQYSLPVKEDKNQARLDKNPYVILVVLMKESPQKFKDFDSNRYIHRIKCAVSDSGLEFPLLREIAFVQLDKALNMYLSKTYSKDEDVELLKLLAMIADVNNPYVEKDIKSDSFLAGIYNDALKLSLNKDALSMIFAEEIAVADYNYNIHVAKKHGRSEGYSEGKNAGFSEGKHEGTKDTNKLYSWLINSGRYNDLKRATEDEAYYVKILKEYELYRFQIAKQKSAV